MAEHPDEHFLHEVLSPLAVADRPVHEIEQPSLVAVDQGPERLRLTGQVAHHDLSIIQLMQRFTLERSLGVNRGCGTLECGPHSYPCVSNGNTEDPALIHFMRTRHKPCLPGLGSNSLSCNRLRFAAGCEMGILSQPGDDAIPHLI